jgi:hypothetical protein
MIDCMIELTTITRIIPAAMADGKSIRFAMSDGCPIFVGI